MEFLELYYNHQRGSLEELRRQYIENPPEGMTSTDIRHMSEDELLDMDYFVTYSHHLANA